MTDKKQWGGRRPNQTGRPKGTIKPEGVRSQHQLRAYDDEWDLIRRFACLVKHGNADACRLALEGLETADGEKGSRRTTSRTIEKNGKSGT